MPQVGGRCPSDPLVPVQLSVGERPSTCGAPDSLQMFSLWRIQTRRRFSRSFPPGRTLRLRGGPGLVPPSVLRGGGAGPSIGAFPTPLCPPAPRGPHLLDQFYSRRGRGESLRSFHRIAAFGLDLGWIVLRRRTRTGLVTAARTGRTTGAVPPPSHALGQCFFSRPPCSCQVGAVLGNGQTPVNTPSCRTDAPRDSNLEVMSDPRKLCGARGAMSSAAFPFRRCRES